MTHKIYFSKIGFDSELKDPLCDTLATLGNRDVDAMANLVSLMVMLNQSSLSMTGENSLQASFDYYMLWALSGTESTAE